MATAPEDWSLNAADRRMVEDHVKFTLEAAEGPDPFKATCGVLPRGVAEAVDWVNSLPPHEVIKRREAVITSIETLGKQLWQDGSAEEWYAGCDPLVRQVAGDANGLLLQKLAEQIAHPDTGVADLLRYGAPIVGVIPGSGLGDRKDTG